MKPKGNNLGRREFMLLASVIAPASGRTVGQPIPAAPGFQTQMYQVSVSGSADCLWSYRLASSGKEYRFSTPTFNLDNRRVTAVLKDVIPSGPPTRLPNGGMEYRFEGAFAGEPSLSLGLVFQAADDNPVVRFSYILKSREERTITKRSGRDDLTYLGLRLGQTEQVKEIRFSNFQELSHSYHLEEVALQASDFEENGASVMGPLFVTSDKSSSMLVAYEHGSQVPDAYLEFALQQKRNVALRAVKGNYFSGQAVDRNRHYQTVWFETGAVAGGEDLLATVFRDFVLRYMSQSLGTRRPFVYYNTWNFQVRNRAWNGKTLFDSMNNDRILQEIDAAHRIGIELYVLDVGWFEKTGDWAVSPARFPDGLKRVREKLESYGMKLGLWFGPTSAGVSSRALQQYRDCVMSWQGVEKKPQAIWETEESLTMCLGSRYGDYFADRLIQLSKELGVTNFKWDAVGQYGCDSPLHEHGNSANTPEERADCFSFQLPRRLTHIAEQIAAACPGATVDFDVTEARRAVGLGFLSAGRYFLMNHGPYYTSYDTPPDPSRKIINVFFYPGAARTWICRTPLPLDKWIPSTLLLTHYLADDPIESQEVNLASLILGQNGLWGDLPAVSGAGVSFMSEMLARYRQVRNDMAASSPVVTGQVSGSPEIYEKIHPKTGRGAVVLFATSKGRYHYVTRRQVSDQHWASNDVRVQRDEHGKAVVDFTLEKPGARVIFFGIDA